MPKQSATTTETTKAAQKAKKMKKLSEIKTPDVLKRKCANKPGVVKLKDACQMIDKSPRADAKKMKMLSQVRTPDVLKKKIKKNEATEKSFKRAATKKINK